MNPVVHFEIVANDVTRAQKFYQDLFGWNIQKVPMPGMDYYMITTTESDAQGMSKTAGAINGGLMPKDPSASSPVLVIRVPNIDQHVEAVKKAGGEIVMPKVEIPNMGWYVRFKDTESNVIGLWQDMK